MTYRIRENETEIDFVLIKNNTDDLCNDAMIDARQSLGSFNLH